MKTFMQNSQDRKSTTTLREDASLASISAEPSIEASMLRTAVSALQKSQIKPLREQVAVEVADNTVQLSGQLGSYHLKQMATETIRKDCHRLGFRIENAIEVS